VYLIYLIDKLQKDKVDSLSIKYYQFQFLSLFGVSYDGNDDDMLARFNELFRSVDRTEIFVKRNSNIAISIFALF